MELPSFDVICKTFMKVLLVMLILMNLFLVVELFVTRFTEDSRVYRTTSSTTMCVDKKCEQSKYKVQNEKTACCDNGGNKSCCLLENNFTNQSSFYDQFGSFAGFLFVLAVIGTLSTILCCCLWSCIQSLCLRPTVYEQDEEGLLSQSRSYGTIDSWSSISEDLAPRYSQLEENTHDGDSNSTPPPTYNTATHQTTLQHQEDDAEERPPSYDTACVPP